MLEPFEVGVIPSRMKLLRTRNWICHFTLSKNVFLVTISGKKISKFHGIDFLPGARIFIDYVSALKGKFILVNGVINISNCRAINTLLFCFERIWKSILVHIQYKIHNWLNKYSNARYQSEASNSRLQVE